MSVLLKTPVTYLGEVEHALDDAEGRLEATLNLGLATVTGARGLVYDPLVAGAAIRKAVGLGELCPNYRSLTLVGRSGSTPGSSLCEGDPAGP